MSGMHTESQPQKDAPLPDYPKGSYRPRCSQKPHKATPTGRLPTETPTGPDPDSEFANTWLCPERNSLLLAVSPPRMQIQTCCHRLSVGFTLVQTWVHTAGQTSLQGDFGELTAHRLMNTHCCLSAAPGTGIQPPPPPCRSPFPGGVDEA